jgi:hypothetical protein
VFSAFAVSWLYNTSLLAAKKSLGEFLS